MKAMEERWHVHVMQVLNLWIVDEDEMIKKNKHIEYGIWHGLIWQKDGEDQCKAWLQMIMCKWEGQAIGSRHDDPSRRWRVSIGLGVDGPKQQSILSILDYLLCLGHGCPILFRCVFHMSIASIHIVWVVSKHMSKSSVKTNNIIKIYSQWTF
jgi:hypothetical protein